MGHGAGAQSTGRDHSRLRAAGSPRALVVGYGNSYRRDDGVGRAVVNALRGELGQPDLGPLDDGFAELGRDVDSVLAHQLVPEFAEMLAPYGLVVFVDAAVGEGAEPLRVEVLAPRPHTSSVSHHLHPATLLDLAGQINGRTPRGLLLSLEGHDFDFGEGLSPETADLVPQAVARIRALVDGRDGAGQDRESMSLSAG
ncbi:MAG TPA: hydrogenase maturation protease [Candidatus Sulfotelmatobacter sp.]|nr:hydrogenase maturation protease [Candidatus Sulfotelmatobacter sp.]